jgi:hypothetical protein
LIQELRTETITVSSRAIVAVSSHSSTEEIESFRFTLADGSELSTLESDAVQGRQLTQWQAPTGSEIASMHVRCTPSNLSFLFETDIGQWSSLFDSGGSGLRIDRFSVKGSAGRLNLFFRSPSGSNNNCLSPITGVDCERIGLNNQIRVSRVDVYCSQQGVTSVSFVGHNDAFNSTYGSSAGQCSSFALLDAGLPSAERIVELLVLQDNGKVFALKVLTDRRRESLCPMPLTGDWKSYKASKPERFVRTVQDQFLEQKKLSVSYPSVYSNSADSDASIMVPTFALNGT